MLPHSTDSLGSPIEFYLDEAALPRILEQAIEKLDKPITVEEWKDALKNSHKGEAPGPDGLPLLYY